MAGNIKETDKNQCRLREKTFETLETLEITFMKQQQH